MSSDEAIGMGDDEDKRRSTSLLLLKATSMHSIEKVVIVLKTRTIGGIIYKDASQETTVSIDTDQVSFQTYERSSTYIC